MSNYNSNLLFNTQVSYEDNNSFEAVESFEPANPFNTPSTPTVVVQQKITSPSAYPSVPQQYASTQVSSTPPSSNNVSNSQPTPHNSMNGIDINRMSISTSNSNNSNNRNSLTNGIKVNGSNGGMSPMKDHLDITVKDPEKLGDSINSYVVYKVFTRAHLVSNPEYKKENTVTRRYSDFLWLRNVLKETRRGIIIPPLPEKAIINKFNKEFVEQRRRELEKFLNRVAETEALVHSPEFKVFLEGTDDQFASAKRARPGSDSMEQSTVLSPTQSNENKTMNKISSFFSSSVNQITNIAGVTSVREIDPWFDDKKMYIAQLDFNLKKLEETVSVIIRKRRELASAMSDFCTAGLTFSSGEIAQSQDIANSFQKMTQVQGNVRTGIDELANNEQGYFEDGLHDYIRVISSVKELINDRLDALLAQQNAERNLESKKEKLEKGRHTAKADQLNREVDEASRRLADAKQEFERISATCKVELQKFDSKRNYEMKRILNFVIRLNLNHYLKASDCWKEFLTEQHQNGDPNYENNKASWGSTTI